MSYERVRREAGRRTLRAGAEAEPLPSQRSELTPGVLAQLQNGAGNAAVGRMLARLRDAPQFKSDSKLKSGLITLDRSTELQAVDTALAAYDLVRGDSLANRHAALLDLEAKINLWKNSKGPVGAWRNTKRGDEIDALETERKAELAVVEQGMKDEKAAADLLVAADRRNRMDQLVTATMKALTDPVAKARAVFAAYMGEFRGKAAYSTTTPIGTTVWDDGGVVACSMISNGLVDLLGHAGVTAKRIEIAPKNFVTKRLGTAFIDPGAEGNVRLPGGAYADERRYFFNKHWIVEVAGGALYLDPTSGIEVGVGAPEIIDYAAMKAENAEKTIFANGTWRVKRVGANNRGDGAYELTPAGEESPSETEDEETSSETSS